MPVSLTAVVPARTTLTPSTASTLPVARITTPVKPRCHNRIRAILVHTTRFSFEGPARLAADIGVSRSTICRILSGKSAPSFRLVSAITGALERAIGRPLDPREIFSDDGTYPTASCCALCGCRYGCMPEAAYDHKDRLKPEYRAMMPGDWSLSPVSASRGTASLADLPVLPAPLTANPPTATSAEEIATESN